MKEYIIKVNKNKIESESIKLVQNDYNSTKLLFDFDFVEDYKKVFQMKLPSGATWVKEIINNELILSDENNTETVPVLVENGLYEYDIAIYDDNSKLTTTDKAYLTVRSEIKGENIELDDRTPILDDLINEVQTLDIDIENSIITITKKDGTQISENVRGEKGDAGSVKFIIANELPTENIDESAIYMIPAEEATEDNTYLEYIYVNGVWESLGSAKVEVNLEDYVKNTDYATQEKGGVVKVNTTYGTRMVSGVLDLMPAQYSEIDNRTHNEYPLYLVNDATRHMIVPANVDYAVKKTFIDNKLVGTNYEWTDEEKAKARELLGALDEVPYATSGIVGGITTQGDYGLTLEPSDKNKLKTVKANDTEIEGKTNIHKVIVPANLDKAIQVGLTTNTIELTNEEKNNATEFLGAVRRTNGARDIYGTDWQGNPTTYRVDYPNDATVNRIPLRAANGAIQINDASCEDGGSGAISDGLQAVNKNYVNSRHVTLTQAEYDALVEAGTVKEDVYYYIVEE